MNYRLLLGDARQMLATLPDTSVQCIVTSPPYFNLRDYGVEGQIGLEPSPEAFVSALVDVFREARRVLSDDGVLLVNLAGSYASGGIDPIQSRQQTSARAYGSDGTVLQDLTAADSAYSGLCDECQGDYLNHHVNIVGNGQRFGQSEPLLSTTARGSERTSSSEAVGIASPLDAPASTTLESLPPRLGVCSHCANCGACRAVLRSADPASLACARTGWRLGTVGTSGLHIGVDSASTGGGGVAWLNYTSKLKHKDLIPTPWMLAMSLQADGWYLRSDIIWHKPDPMPESVQDRPTKAHEYVFLLTKSARYYWNADAIREKYAESTLKQFEVGYDGKGTKDYEAAGVQNPSSVKARIIEKSRKKVGPSRSDGQQPHSFHCGYGYNEHGLGANSRTVWTIPTEPSPYEHFAVMPKALARKCIVAGCPPGGTVLDPFAGMATTGVVALEEGRSFVGIELNTKYHSMARERLAGVAPLLATEISA